MRHYNQAVPIDYHSESEPYALISTSVQGTAKQLRREADAYMDLLISRELM